MKNWFKKISIPSGEQTTVIAYNSWVVRWNSKNNNGYDYVRQAEIFPSEEDANKFAEQLRGAFKLLRYKSGGWADGQAELTEVKVEANQSKIAQISL